MINVYEDIRNKNGEVVPGRTKLFIKETLDDGTIDLYMSGISCVPESSGTLFVVDDWLISQIDKLLFIDGGLAIKDGEELEVPFKSETELKREELLKQLAELDAQ